VQLAAPAELLPEPFNRLGTLALTAAVELDEAQEQLAVGDAPLGRPLS
jgi:hypothetical protein